MTPEETKHNHPVPQTAPLIKPVTPEHKKDTPEHKKEVVVEEKK